MHQIIISKPLVVNYKLQVVCSIKDWNEFYCFYFPVEKIDSKVVAAHITWKFVSDERAVIYDVFADADIEETEHFLLNLRNWEIK